MEAHVGSCRAFGWLANNSETSPERLEHYENAYHKRRCLGAAYFFPAAVAKCCITDQNNQLHTAEVLGVLCAAQGCEIKTVSSTMTNSAEIQTLVHAAA